MQKKYKRLLHAFAFQTLSIIVIMLVNLYLNNTTVFISLLIVLGLSNCILIISKITNKE